MARSCLCAGDTETFGMALYRANIALLYRGINWRKQGAATSSPLCASALWRSLALIAHRRPSVAAQRSHVQRLLSCDNARREAAVFGNKRKASYASVLLLSPAHLASSSSCLMPPAPGEEEGGGERGGGERRRRGGRKEGEEEGRREERTCLPASSIPSSMPRCCTTAIANISQQMAAQQRAGGRTEEGTGVLLLSRLWEA